MFDHLRRALKTIDRGLFLQVRCLSLGLWGHDQTYLKGPDTSYTLHILGQSPVWSLGNEPQKLSANPTVQYMSYVAKCNQKTFISSCNKLFHSMSWLWFTWNPQTTYSGISLAISFFFVSYVMWSNYELDHSKNLKAWILGHLKDSGEIFSYVFSRIFDKAGYLRCFSSAILQTRVVFTLKKTYAKVVIFSCLA